MIYNKLILIYFFSKYRELFGANSLEFAFSEDWDTHQLIAAVRAAHPANTAFLDDPALVCAVNHVVVSHLATLKDGDEVAFYPPVTGG